jgi:Flp pilus assembly protein protease CpaA
MFLLPATPMIVALISAFAAAVTDVWRYRIYNALTLPLLVSGLAYHGLVSGGIGFVISVFATCVGLVPMAALYLLGGMGAGDVKLMAGLGAWLGPGTTAEVLLASCIAAGIYSVVILLYNASTAELARLSAPPTSGVNTEVRDRISSELASVGRRRRMIPFGLMIFAGLVYTLVFCVRV